MATNVESALVEAKTAVDDMVDPLEGLRDLERTNLRDETKREVVESIHDYERRQILLEAFIRAGEALVNDGHPTLAPRAISVSAMKDLADQKRTIDAAITKFASNEATTLGLVAGATEPK